VPDVSPSFKILAFYYGVMDVPLSALGQQPTVHFQSFKPYEGLEQAKDEPTNIIIKI
jgi:hypothetical protein